MTKIFAPIIWLFKLIYKILDFLIITPFSRLFYKVRDLFRNNNNKFESILNRPNVLIYFSLVCAIIVFLLVDSKVINLTENEAEVISGQAINVTYNDEAYVVEGIPDSVDITLIGNKSSIYLATQLGDHEVSLDLTGYGPGTYKVKLKYNHSVESVNYKLDPSTVTVKISEKVSEVHALSYDLLNESDLNSTLSVTNVQLSSTEVICKSSQEILDKIATVKALIDANDITLSQSGTETLDDVELVAYDSNGNKLSNVEMVPSKVSATVTIDSYHASKNVNINVTGEMASGKAISSISSSVKSVEVYGSKSVVDAIDAIDATVSVDGLSSNTTTSVELDKPSGVRYMDNTKTSVSITVADESQITVTGVAINTSNLASGLSASASSSADQTVDVIVKGVADVINTIDSNAITASVDLSGLGVGSHTVPVKVTVNDDRVKVQSTKTQITVKIVQK
jgi:YbbR domain-containing protein